MAKVIVKEGETLDQALKRFKNQIAADGLMDEIRKREYYRSPSQKRKEKQEAAARARWVEEQKAKRYRKRDE